MDIVGVAAVVTGGASGLGGATAERLAQLGAKVTIFDMNADSGARHAEALGGRFHSVDVSDEAAVRAALEDAESLNGKARILVNCAGIGPAAKVIGRDGAPMPLGDYQKVISVNLIGTFNMVSQFAARLIDAEPIGEERGVIINTASIAAFDGQIGQAAYASSKGGVVSLALPLARELSRYAIRVMTIAPGIFLTPMLATVPEEVRDALSRDVPFPRRLGRPEEYAQLVEAIIANTMLNGEVIRLDGAIRMAPK